MELHHIKAWKERSQLGKFETKVDEGIFVGYPTTKAYKVFNLIRTRIVVESINVTFDDKKITGSDEDSHEPLSFRNDTNPDAVPNKNPDELNLDEVLTDDNIVTDITQIGAENTNNNATIEEE